MKKVLIDSSVWIDFFRFNKYADQISQLINQDLICINDLILTEIVPFLMVKKNKRVIDLLYSIDKIDLDIDWQNIIELQVENVKNGLNKVGIPDLIILQNILQNGLRLFSADKHFLIMNRFIGFEFYLF